MPRPFASTVRLAHVLTLALALGILVTTLWPSHGHHPPFTLRDKGLHLLAFAALILPMAVTEPSRALSFAPVYIAFGAAIEVIQPAFGRGAEWLDLLADALGVGLGLALGWGVRAAFRRR